KYRYNITIKRNTLYKFTIFYAIINRKEKPINYSIFFLEGFMLIDGLRMDIAIKEEDLRHFNMGEDPAAYRLLGAHMKNMDNKTIVRFAVWAPNAVSVSVVGDFNGWDGNANPMEKLGMSG